MIVENPVIRGFSPDPSLLKVGEDYYIATSTFEWFPGVAIYHSKDLVNWELSDYALKNDTWMDLSGIDTSCGIWAPNLTYDKGRFYLLYTIVYTNHHWYKDTWNYMTSAPSVHGPWTEPVPLTPSFTLHPCPVTYWNLRQRPKRESESGTARICSTSALTAIRPIWRII